MTPAAYGFSAKVATLLVLLLLTSRRAIKADGLASGALTQMVTY